MNIFLRIIPFFIGVGFTYLALSGIAHFDKPVKFLLTVIFLYGISYFFIQYNIVMMKREGTLSSSRILAPNRLGHLLIPAGALAGGAGFIENSLVLLALALACFWFADDMLTKTCIKQADTPPAIPPLFHADSQDTITIALLNAIAEKRKTDPFVGAKLGGKEIFQRVLNALKDERGVHTESLLCALGALAGYACQASLHAQSTSSDPQSPSPFVIIEAGDGKKYYFGDQLNRPLAESEYSVWSLTGGAAKHHGAQNLPDIRKIFEYVTQSIGSNDFGLPRLPNGLHTSATPLAYVKAMWPYLFPQVKQFCATPQEWPILFGVAIQEAIALAKNVVAPDDAALIVMESAIPMSKVNLLGERGF